MYTESFSFWQCLDIMWVNIGSNGDKDPMMLMCAQNVYLNFGRNLMPWNSHVFLFFCGTFLLHLFQLAFMVLARSKLITFKRRLFSFWRYKQISKNEISYNYSENPRFRFAWKQRKHIANFSSFLKYNLKALLFCFISSMKVSEQF